MLNKDICKKCLKDYCWDRLDNKLWNEKNLLDCPINGYISVHEEPEKCPYYLEHVIKKEN